MLAEIDLLVFPWFLFGDFNQIGQFSSQLTDSHASSKLNYDSEHCLCGIPTNDLEIKM